MAAGLCILGVAGCDALFVDLEPVGTDMEIRLTLTEHVQSQTSFGDLTGPLSAVRFARFRFVSGEAARDTVVAARFDGSSIEARVTLLGSETRGWLEIQAELLMGSQQVLFRGHALLQAHELAPHASIDLSPVAERVAAVLPLSLTALGDTVPLNGQVQMANGHAILGTVITWAALDPSVAEVVGGDRLVSRSNGSTTLTASALGATSAYVLVVRQTPVILTGIGPADTTVSSGSSFQARPFGEDRNGFPLLPGARVVWSAIGVVNVDSLGNVSASSAGLGFVEATLGADLHSARVTVTP